MRERWTVLRLVLQAACGWCIGAVFAVVWLWLFLGVQLTPAQAWTLIGLFSVAGVIFGAVQAWRRGKNTQTASIRN